MKLSSTNRRTAKPSSGSSGDRGRAQSGSKRASNARSATRQSQRAESDKASDRKR